MLIFLDIDGVMVPAVSWKVPENLEDGFPMFTKKATTALHSLISDYPNATIILTTSHRDRFTINQWRTIFKKRGIDIENIDRLAPNTDLSKKRKDEIEAWFQSHQIKDNFIIIDDDTTLNALPAKLKHNLIITRSSVGLTTEDIQTVA